MSVKDKLLRVIAQVDLRLKKVIGEENEILYHFVRLLLAAVILACWSARRFGLLPPCFKWSRSFSGPSLPRRTYLLAIALLAGAARSRCGLIAGSLKRSHSPKHNRRFPAATLHPTGPNRNGSLEATLSGKRCSRRDQPTRIALEHVLAALQRFDHRPTRRLAGALPQPFRRQLGRRAAVRRVGAGQERA